MADANGDVDWGNVQGPTVIFPSATASRRSDAVFPPLFRRFFDFSLLFSAFLRYGRTSGDEIRRANSSLPFPRSRRCRKPVDVTRAPSSRRLTDVLKTSMPASQRRTAAENGDRIRFFRANRAARLCSKCKTDRRVNFGEMCDSGAVSRVPGRGRETAF